MFTSSLPLHGFHGQTPRYHLLFSNTVPKSTLQMLADADEHEVIRQCAEYYLDFVPVAEVGIISR